MTYDIQSISIVDALQLVSATEIPGASPRAIRLVGRGGFEVAQRVLINDYAVDTFVLVSGTVMIVSVPEVFSDTPLNEMVFDILASEFTSRNPVRILFGPTKRIRKTKGLQKLVQVVLKVLLSRPGSNKFSPGVGGGLLDGLGASLDTSGKSQNAAVVAQAVTSTESQILAAQSGARGLPASERLLSLTLVGVQFNADRGEVRAVLKLVSLAGQSIELPLPL